MIYHILMLTQMNFIFHLWGIQVNSFILKEGRKDGDYTLEMLEILPTLKIYYEDRLHKILASEVKYVLIRMGM